MKFKNSSFFSPYLASFYWNMRQPEINGRFDW